MYMDRKNQNPIFRAIRDSVSRLFLVLLFSMLSYLGLQSGYLDVMALFGVCTILVLISFVTKFKNTVAEYRYA